MKSVHIDYYRLKLSVMFILLIVILLGIREILLSLESVPYMVLASIMGVLLVFLVFVVILMDVEKRYERGEFKPSAITPPP